jgi:hypothetical protein
MRPAALVVANNKNNEKKEENLPPAPFIMLSHAKSAENARRFSKLTNALVRQFDDGLSNINSLAELVSVKFLPLFTHLAVKVNN